MTSLCTSLGLTPVDYGTLAGGATDIEDIPQRLFPGWKWPLLISVPLWTTLFLVTVLREAVCGEVDGVEQLVKWNWDEALDLFRHVNKACDCHAMWLLALCYIPGCLAGYIQLIR